MGQVGMTDKRKAERDAIWEQRPDLKGKSLEAIRRIMRREARLSVANFSCSGLTALLQTRPISPISLFGRSDITTRAFTHLRCAPAGGT
jgi:hypothetical protein